MPDAVAAAPAAPTSPSGPAAAHGAVPAPDKALGADWRKSSDVLVTGAGDSNGFHLYVAREKDSFAWSTLATLTASTLDLGPWTGQVCVTGSGRYAVAVYAPAMAANKPKLLAGGALAAVVDTRTGQARQVATGVQLSYFNPACGPGDRVLITRAIGEEMRETDLLSVDAAAGAVTSIRRIKAQFTTPTAAPDGDYGIAKGALVRVDATGALTTVARPQGRPFAVTATAKHGIDVASVDGQQAVVERYEHGALKKLGTGPWDGLELHRLSDGRNAVVGDTSRVTANVPDLTKLASDRQVRAVSAEGHLLAVDVVPQQAAQAMSTPLARPRSADAGPVKVTVRATRSGQSSTATVATTKAPTLNTLPSTTVGPRADASTRSVGGVKATATNISNPVCAVPRNDPAAQALQVSPDMVEWAADQAVHGRLTVQRPQNYLHAGRSAYSPQGMFPLRPLSGGGEVPAQVMLGIVAQESNMSQASWHSVPGDTGNPLIANYYGNGGADINVIDYEKSDCGYGISQVTDGMRGSGTPSDKQWAIAVDYAANIAAGLNILIEKWNQVRDDPRGRTWLNDGNPKWIENWYLAVWAYNSGFHTSAEANDNNGHWGIGWLNNPANPAYKANRQPFLRNGSTGDAAHPSDWSYPERVMGWIESPQLKGGSPATGAYAQPNFGSFVWDHLSLPGSRAFCGPVNSCDPSPTNSNPCPAESEACWWNGHVDFANCAHNECATEKLPYALGSAEPGVKRVYDRDCGNLDPGRDPNFDSTRPGGMQMVYDLNDTQNYALGCQPHSSDGKFQMRLGIPPGSERSLYGQIDLHQLGAGYQGHAWFTHTYRNQFENGPFPSPPQGYHKIVASWTPNLVVQAGQTRRYDIAVHLPSHGAEATADYIIYKNGMDAGTECSINQGDKTSSLIGNGKDVWVYLGSYDLGPGARVGVDNIKDRIDGATGKWADGTTDIAFDAMAFIPIKSGGKKCNENL